MAISRPSERAEGDAQTVPLDRRLVAVMFTDMVGYTALIQADERVALDKRDWCMSALESHHDTFGGTIIQRLGDGSMSKFPSSLAAVLAAVEIQRELAAKDVPIRIGVHVGEVVVDSERLTGDAVNIAARIESFSSTGRKSGHERAEEHLSWASGSGGAISASRLVHCSPVWSQTRPEQARRLQSWRRLRLRAPFSLPQRRGARPPLVRVSMRAATRLRPSGPECDLDDDG